MTTSSQYNSRIQLKTDTSTNWNKATNFKPLKGELILYSDLNKAKIGDGVTLLSSLKFINQNELDSKLNSIKAIAGSNINTVGTPSVTAANTNGETTLTFNYLKGSKGDTGPQGPKGDTGATGATPTIKVASGSNIGSIGTPSVTANTSGTTTTFTFNYLKGATGATGAKGDTGAQGPQGIQGVKGDQGIQGPKGDTGATGPQGATGKTAYAYAQDGGYTGTESAFMADLAEAKLPLAGGTMTGTLNINRSEGSMIKLTRTGTTSLIPLIGFANDSGTLGYISVNAGGVRYFDANASNGRDVLDTENIITKNISMNTLTLNTDVSSGTYKNILDLKSFTNNTTIGRIRYFPASDNNYAYENNFMFIMNNSGYAHQFYLPNTANYTSGAILHRIFTGSYGTLASRPTGMYKGQVYLAYA